MRGRPGVVCIRLFRAGVVYRLSEALNLTVERVDLAQKTVVLETLKRRVRGHYRPVPVPPVLCVLLRALAATREPSAHVWHFSRATGYRCIKRLMADAGLSGTKACPKGMRHAMAVACLAHKIPLTTVRKWMGHAKLETTAIYLDVSGDEERALAKRLWVGN